MNYVINQIPIGKKKKEKQPKSKQIPTYSHLLPVAEEIL